MKLNLIWDARVSREEFDKLKRNIAESRDFFTLDCQTTEGDKIRLTVWTPVAPQAGRVP